MEHSRADGIGDDVSRDRKVKRIKWRGRRHNMRARDERFSFIKLASGVSRVLIESYHGKLAFH